MAKPWFRRDIRHEIAVFLEPASFPTFTEFTFKIKMLYLVYPEVFSPRTLEREEKKAGPLRLKKE
jgi:hypothetical protein